jgi:endonuclease/exonuclease/phosphatase family metal-dependent hydrolase
MHSLQIATWNLDGYHGCARVRLPRQIEILDSLQADILVLTEVRDTTQISGMRFWWSDPGQPPYTACDRAVGIASTWCGSALAVTDSRLSVCVALEASPPLGPVIVYGTVIPYAMDGVRQKAAKAWERHQKAVDDVVTDLCRLRSDFPNARLLLAGDFNTSLDGTDWYGHPEARVRLVQGLTGAGLHCHTLENIRTDRGSDRAIVDHIWSSMDLSPAEPMQIWCDKKLPDRLSDHNGVSLRLAMSP